MSPALTKKAELDTDRKKGGVRILVAAGSSGGHIFAALGFLDALRQKYKDADTLLILSRNTFTNKIPDFGHKVNYVSISAIRPGLNFKNFIAILRFFKGSVESLILLFRFKPDIIVGFGALVSIPAVVSGRILGIKTVIHEQNVIPGRANRFLAKFTDKIAVSFDETKEHFKKYESKVALTGNPMRKELEQIDKGRALNLFGFNNEKFTILVMGGSQGSRSINAGFLKAISGIPDKLKLQVIHLTGPFDCDLLKERYRDLGIDARLFSFFEPMQYAYSASGLVVSRGGASTITEIMFYRLPAIIIPYPFAYKHQMANAKVLERMGSAIIIQDNELDKDILKDNIENLLNNPQRAMAMHLRYGKVPEININNSLVNEALSFN